FGGRQYYHARAAGSFGYAEVHAIGITIDIGHADGFAFEVGVLRHFIFRPYIFVPVDRENGVIHGGGGCGRRRMGGRRRNNRWLLYRWWYVFHHRRVYVILYDEFVIIRGHQPRADG